MPIIVQGLLWPEGAMLTGGLGEVKDACRVVGPANARQYCEGEADSFEAAAAKGEAYEFVSCSGRYKTRYSSAEAFARDLPSLIRTFGSCPLKAKPSRVPRESGPDELAAEAKALEPPPPATSAPPKMPEVIAPAANAPRPAGSALPAAAHKADQGGARAEGPAARKAAAPQAPPATLEEVRGMLDSLPPVGSTIHLDPAGSREGMEKHFAALAAAEARLKEIRPQARQEGLGDELDAMAERISVARDRALDDVAMGIRGYLTTVRPHEDGPVTAEDLQKVRQEHAAVQGFMDAYLSKIPAGDSARRIAAHLMMARLKKFTFERTGDRGDMEAAVKKYDEIADQAGRLADADAARRLRDKIEGAKADIQRTWSEKGRDNSVVFQEASSADEVRGHILMDTKAALVALWGEGMEGDHLTELKGLKARVEEKFILEGGLAIGGKRIEALFSVPSRAWDEAVKHLGALPTYSAVKKDCGPNAFLICASDAPLMRSCRPIDIRAALDGSADIGCKGAKPAAAAAPARDAGAPPDARPTDEREREAAQREIEISLANARGEALHDYEAFSNAISRAAQALASYEGTNPGEARRRWSDERRGEIAAARDERISALVADAKVPIGKKFVAANHMRAVAILEGALAVARAQPSDEKKVREVEAILYDTRMGVSRGRIKAVRVNSVDARRREAAAEEIEALAEFRSRHPNCFQSDVFLGWLHLALRDFSKAREALERFFAAMGDPRNGEAMARRDVALGHLFLGLANEGLATELKLNGEKLQHLFAARNEFALVDERAIAGEYEKISLRSLRERVNTRIANLTPPPEKP